MIINTISHLAIGSPELHLVCAVVVSAPLLYAGLAKMLDPTHFALALPRFGLSDLPPTERTSWTVGMGEVAAAACVLARADWIGVVPATAGYVAFALLMLRAVRSGAAGECGCLGALPGRIDAWAIARNALFVVATAILGIARQQGLLAEYDTRSWILTIIFLTLMLAALEIALEIRRAAARPARDNRL